MAVTLEAQPAPVPTLNTTPLIDIMLVLLVMFIVTVPLQTHAVKIALPQSRPSTIPPPRTDFNVVGVDAGGQVRFNGTPIDLTTLRIQLDRTTTMVPEPELHLASDPMARYARVDELLAVVNGRA